MTPPNAQAEVTDATAGRDRCPRCGGPFRCGVAGPAPCACTSVRLSAAQLAALRQRFDRCLCLACLRQVADGGPVDGSATPEPGTEPEPGTGCTSPA